MRNRFILLIVMSSMALGSALVPQHEAQAKTCYDISTKQPIPCPKTDNKSETKTDYSLTQQAKKNIVPTNSPTFTPTPTNTPIPTATQPASLLIVPVKAIPQPNACDPRIWPGIMGLGAVLIVWGFVMQVRRARSPGAISLDDYSAESHANQSTLDVHIGKVDFGDSNGGQNSGSAVPIAVGISGITLVASSATGLLNLISCTAWQGTLAVGLLIGAVTFLIRRSHLIVKTDPNQGEGYKYPELHTHNHDPLKESIGTRPEKHDEQ